MGVPATRAQPDGGLNGRAGARVLRSGHVEFRVADLDRARHFYVDLLGFVETARDGDALYLR